MAQVARSFSNVTPNVNSGHMPSGSRGIASSSSPAVEEIGANAGVEAEQHFLFQDYANDDFDRRRRAAPPVKNTAGKFDATSSAFAHLLGQEQAEHEKSTTPQYGTNAFRGMLSRAINAYETTAQVISGGANPLGASITLSL